MRGYINEGNTVTVTAPYALTSGQGAQVGAMFGVAQHDAANAAEVTIVTRGAFQLTKAASQAWTVGAAIYWDNAARNATTTVASNKLIGYAIAAVGSGAGETIGRVNVMGL